MRNKPLALVLVLIATIAGMMWIPRLPIFTHASPGTGLVCIANPATNPANCPATPPTISVLSTATTVQVAVNIAGSDAFSGYTVGIQADPTKLRVASVDAITGSVVPGATVFVICIDGVAQPGGFTTVCAPWAALGNAQVQIFTFSSTTAPTTGHLFTITYNIVGSTTGTPISYVQDTALNTCETTADSSNPPNCVLFSLFGATPNLENVQTATFSNLPNFSLTATFSSFTVPRAASGTNTITVTSLDLYAQTVTFSTPSVSPTGPIATLNMSSVTLLPNGAHNVTLTVSTSSSTTPGNYNVTVTATGRDQTNPATNLARSVSVIAVVTIQDFSLTATPATLQILHSKSDNSTIKATSLNGFAGTVTFSTSVSPIVPNGPTTSLNTTTVTLTAGGTRGVLVTVATTASTPIGAYVVNVTGTSGPLVHSVFITVQIGPDFTMIATPTSLTVNASSPVGLSAITLTSIAGFNGTINLATSGAPAGLTVSLNPTSVTITAPMPAGQATLSVSALSSLRAGLYTITVTGVNSTGSPPPTHSLKMNITVTPDFRISASPPAITIDAGSSSASIVTVSSSNSFNGTISLTTSAYSTQGPTYAVSISLNPASVMVSTTSTSAQAILTASSSTVGVYTIFVAGKNGTAGPSHNAIVLLTVLDFSIIPSPSSLSLTTGATGTTTLTLTSLGGFTGNVTLTASVSPSGPTSTPTQSSLLLKAQGTNSTTLTISLGTAPAGTYTVTVTASRGALTHATTVTLTVTNPSVRLVSVSLSSASSTIGQPVTITVDLSNNGSVDLNFTLIAVDPNNVTLASKQVVLAAGQDSGPINLSWDTTGYKAGTYTVTIRLLNARVSGAGGNPVTLATSSFSGGTLTLNQPSQGFTLPGGNTLWAIIAIVALLVIVAFFLFRRKPPKALGTES